MKFAIRDDDISYFTDPKPIQRIYKDIWKEIPISVAVVPYIYPTPDFAPPKYWAEKRLYPIGENKRIVEFLKRKIRENKICIMLHGYSHKDYREGAEFVAGEELREKVMRGKNYLEGLLDTSIKCFVPPHNALSRKGLKSVIDCGLNVVQTFYPHPWEEKQTPSLFNLVRILFIKYRHTATQLVWKSMNEYELVDYGTYKELRCYGLNPISRYDVLERYFHSVQERDGIFCLAVHLDAFNQRMFHKFKGLINLSKKHDNVEYLSVQDIFNIRAKV